MPESNKTKNYWLREGRGVMEDIPQNGPERMWFVVKTHFMELFGLNLLVLAFCVPIVTIPGALAGMTNIMMKWLRDDPVFFWPDFFYEFKSMFFKRLGAWFILTITPISLSLYTLMFGYKDFALVILLLLGLVSTLIQAYLFPIFVLINIPVGAALKDALYLAFLEWKTSLRVLFFSGVLIALCLIFTLYAIPVIVLGLVSLYQLTICLWVKEPIENRLMIQSQK